MSFYFRFCIILFFSILKPAYSIVDLHQHLLMKYGMGPLLFGQFDEMPKSTSPDQRLQSKTSGPALVECKEFDLTLISLYAHPYLNFSVKNSIRHQIKVLNEWNAHHPEFVIAKSSKEARFLLQSKKRVLVLSLETAAGTLDSESDLKEFIDESGIRIVTFLHLSPDDFGKGVALMPNGGGPLAAPIQWLQSLLKQSKDSLGVYLNPNGLSQKGKEMAENLMKRKVWIDLSHSSDQTQNEFEELFKKFPQPHLHTHTSLRAFAKRERGISEEQLRRVKESGGIIGLMPTSDMLDDHRAQTSTEVFWDQWDKAESILGVGNVFMGSDWNAPVKGLQGKSEHHEIRDFKAFTLKKWAEKELNLRNSLWIEHFLKAWDQLSSP